MKPPGTKTLSDWTGVLLVSATVVLVCAAFTTALYFGISALKDGVGESAASYFAEGKRAALNGLPAESCPYRDSWEHERWMKGWQAGYLELKGKK